MSTVVSAIGSALHVLGIASVITFSTFRLIALRKQNIAWTRYADNGNGLGAVLLYGSGLWRLFGGLEKPLAFYTDNPVFWVKIGFLAIASALEMYPQYVVLPWHFRVSRRQPIEPKPGQFEWMFGFAAAQLPFLLGVVFCAALMSRGVGLPSAEPPPATAMPGRVVYEQYCLSCHQADGKGLNGTIAANFVDDHAVLEKSDEVLLGSIANGMTGTIGAMPAWGGALTQDQRREVLAYIRASYGK